MYRDGLLGLGWLLALELTSIELIRHEIPGGGACLNVTQSRGVADEPPMLVPGLKAALEDL
jgi:hypothetical protein